ILTNELMSEAVYIHFHGYKRMIFSDAILQETLAYKQSTYDIVWHSAKPLQNSFLFHHIPWDKGQPNGKHLEKCVVFRKKTQGMLDYD
ncbi:Hypothetical protein FKW44_022600, partial [Caligus rogercresseyi]